MLTYFAGLLGLHTDPTAGWSPSNIKHLVIDSRSGTVVGLRGGDAMEQLATPSLDSMGTLSAASTLSMIEARLGAAMSGDQGDEGRTLYYRHNLLNLDFVGTRTDTLKRLVVYSDD